jgi:hypothetical protein
MAYNLATDFDTDSEDILEREEPLESELEEEDLTKWNIVTCSTCGKEYDLLSKKVRSRDGNPVCPHCGKF